MDGQTAQQKDTKLDMVILIYSQNFIRRSIKKEYKNIIEMIWKTFSHTAIKKVQINGHFKSEKCFKLTIKEVKHTWINTEINCQAQLTQI